MKELELYIHIPFCVKKCAYCDFLSAPASEETKMLYVDTLLAEIEEFENADDYEVVSAFFGGGTPSILPGEEIGRIMNALEKKFRFRMDAEITLEANPGTVGKEKLLCYKRAGINRLSLGLQSAHEKELKKLGRIHTFKEFLESFQTAREAGFSNINVDLMSALPGQTKESYRDTLNKITSLDPEHISVYSLIIEEGTLFYEAYGEDVRLLEEGKKTKFLPTEEEERAIYALTEEMLTKNGYIHYEISNYAKPERECRHNLGYWERRDYLGFGLGASSLLNPVRYKNTDSLKDYLAKDFSKKEFLVLTKDNQIEETMFLGLRILEGVSKKKFQETFSCPLGAVYYHELEKLKAQGLVDETEDYVRLTKRGIDVSNPVLAEFLLS